MERLFLRHNLGKHSGGLLVSPPDNGKTTLFRVCEKRYPWNKLKGKRIMPVVRIDAPPQSSEKRLLGQILKPFDPKAYEYGDSEARMRRVMNYFSENKVKLLLIDEVHFLLNGTGRQQAECLSVLRNLTNQLQVSIILAGTESALTLISHHPEIASRFTVYQLPKWSYNLEFLKFLVALESRLPLPAASELASKEKAIYLLKGSGGKIGKVCRIIKESAIDALQNGEDSISLERMKHTVKTQGKEVVEAINDMKYGL
jgi:hypothetical protein